MLVCAGAVWLLTGNSPAPPAVTVWSAADETESAADDVPAEPLTGGVDAGEPSRTELEDEAEWPDAGDEARPEVGIRGRVLEPGGRPLPGAAVVLELRRGTSNYRGQRNVLRREATSAADGTFAFRGPGYATMAVAVQLAHERYAPTIVDRAFTAASGTLDLGDLRMLTGGALLGSVVGEDDTPVAGASVRVLPASGNRLLWSRDRASLLPAAAADANGWFRITHLTPGVYRLDVSAPLHERKTTAELLVVDGREEELAPIRLGAGHRVAGTVFAPDGSRLENANVRVRAARGRDFRGRSDAEGRFVIDHITDTELSLEVRAPGCVTHRTPQLDPRQSGSDHLTIRLVAGLRLTGNVRDAATGGAVTRFAARLRRIGDLAEPGNGDRITELRARIEAAMREGRLEEGKGLLLELGAAGPMAPMQGPTDDQRRVWGGPIESIGAVEDRPGGRFEFSDLDEGVYVVDIASPDHLRLASDRVELRAGGPSPHLELSLAAGLSVTGTVVSAGDRQPLAKARVELVEADADRAARLESSNRGMRSLLQTESDADGRFRFGHAPPGRYTVRARADGHATGSSEPFALYAPVADLVVTLAQTARLVGTVSGIPPGKEGAARVVAFGGVARMRSASVGADGAFALDRLEPGDYVVRAFVGDTRTFLTEQMRRLTTGERSAPDVTLRSGETRELALTATVTPTGSVTGTVLHNGRPGAGFQVALEPRESRTTDGARLSGRWFGRSFRATSDPQGRFEITDVPAGDYLLTARGPLRSGVQLVAQECRVQADGATQRTITIDTGSLRGRIVADDGTAASELDGTLQLYAGLTRLPDDASDLPADHRHTIRVRDGAFVQTELPIGDYLLVSALRGRRPAQQLIHVDLDGVTEIEVPAGEKK